MFSTAATRDLSTTTSHRPRGLTLIASLAIGLGASTASQAAPPAPRASTPAGAVTSAAAAAIAPARPPHDIFGLPTTIPPPRRPGPVVTTTAPIKRLVILGDSLSDDHRMWQYRRTLWIPDPALGYWSGRFTNGYNWVDHLRKLSPGLAINNLAFGGAQSLGRYKSRVIYIPNLADQLKTAVTSRLLASAQDTGVVIWIGANDVLDHLDKKHPDAVKGLIMKNVDAVTAQLVGKYKIPANHVFVVTLPPMDRVPYYAEQSHRGLQQAAHTGIDATNAAIENLARSRGLVAVPAHTFIARWLDGTYRDPYMTNLTAACLPMDPAAAGKKGLNPFKSHAQKIKECKSKNNAFAMFFDTMHPTAVAHCGLSILFKRYLEGGSLDGLDTRYCRTAKMSDVLPSPAESVGRAVAAHTPRRPAVRAPVASRSPRRPATPKSVAPRAPR